MGRNGQRQFGSVRRLPSGRWQARVLLPDGRRIKAPDTFATKTDATLWLDHQRAALAAGRPGDPERSRVLLEDFAWEWLSHQGRLAPRTVEIYTHQLEAHILPCVANDIPAMGNQPLNALTPELIRTWHQALVFEYSRSIAAKAYVRLRQILNQAVDDERIVRNPCRIRRAGAEHHGEQRFATMPELLELVEVTPERFRAIVLTAGLAGLRQGELLALRRGDIDLGAHRPEQFPQARLAAGDRCGGAQGPPLSRPTPHGGHAGCSHRRHDEGAHEPAGSRQCQCSADLPARIGRARQVHRRGTDGHVPRCPIRTPLLPQRTGGSRGGRRPSEDTKRSRVPQRPLTRRARSGRSRWNLWPIIETRDRRSLKFASD